MHAHRSKWRDAVLAGLTGTALLGASADLSAQSPADRYASQTTQAVAAPADPGVVRRGEFEAALLADPLTFPYPLQAVFHDNTLEIHGSVPSFAVRERVLTLARSVHKGAISDRLEIEVTSSRRVRTMPADLLRTALLQRLRAAFPKYVAGINVQVDERGNVTIDGAVPSWTEKRTINLTLRDTPGCTSMTNRLVLTAETPARASGIVQASGTAQTGGLMQAGGIPQDPTSLFEQSRTTDATMRLEASIMHICPQVRNLHVSQVGPLRYRIDLEAQDEATSQTCVGRIFKMNELRRFYLDVVVNTPRP